MGGVVRLLDVSRTPDRARFAFDVSADLAHLFWDARELELRCSEGVADDPVRLVGAFAYGLAPVGWTQGADIVLPWGMARGALGTLREVGSFLCRHYGWPMHDPFRNAAAAEERRPPGQHGALLFSGGIDSSAALLDVQDRVDWVVHVSNFENLESRMTPEQIEDALDTTHAVADSRGLGWMHVRTNIAAVFKHNRFDDRFPEGCSFWLGLEHLHHLATGLVAGGAMLSRSYLAGGFDELHRRVGSCAASARLVDRYRWAPSLTLVHEFCRRQEKVERLIDEAPELLRTLRVCYSSGAGTCSACRKCQATALMIISGGGTLSQTAFPVDIVERLITKIEEIRHMDESEHRFFHQALAGRRLSGERQERWAQLLELLHAQR
jgi:hypothetical protein